MAEKLQVIKYQKKAMALSKILFALMSLSLLLNSCEEKKHKKHKKKDKEEEVSSASSDLNKDVKDTNTSINCDTSLWKYVYNRDRLEVKDICTTVSGVIEESSADEDGDQHMLLKLDGGNDILTKKNLKKKQGDLVIEAVCANHTTLAKVGNTCNGYVNHINLPKLGDHVKVTGSLVIDSHNGWSEIHPITKIEVIK